MKLLKFVRENFPISCKTKYLGHLTSQPTTVPSATKHVVQIFQPSSLYNFEDQNTQNMSIPIAKNNHSQGKS